MQTVDLIGTCLRATRLTPLVAGGALSTCIMVVPVLLGLELEVIDVTLTLHLAMFALLTGAAFVLDDAAYPSTEVLPISARRTAAIRMGLALVPVSVFWAIALWIAPHTLVGTAEYARAGLVVEVYACIAWVWAVAVFAAHRRRGIGSALAAPVPLVVAVAAALSPDRLAVFVSPGSPGYGDSRLRWAVVLAVGLVVLSVVTRRPGRAPSTG
jgi:GNAT superfamily N-acetyltransferase